MLYRCALIFLFALLAPLPVRAEPICRVADLLGAINTSSREALTTADPAIAASRIGNLDLALRRLSKSTFMTTAPSGHDAATPRSLKGFIETRQSMVKVFRSQGPKAARTKMMDPLYKAQGFAVNRMLRRLDCSTRAPPHTPESGPEASSHSPNGTSDRSGAGLGLSDTLGSVQRIDPDWNIAILALLCVLIGFIVIVARMGRRSDTRYYCDIPTQLRIGDVTLPARITNISRTGVQLCAESPFTAGDRGNILVDGASIKVKVIWVNQHFLGMKFQSRLKFSPKSLITDHC